MLDGHKVEIGLLIEKRFPLSQLQDAYALANTPGSVVVRRFWKKHFCRIEPTKPLRKSLSGLSLMYSAPSASRYTD